MHMSKKRREGSQAFNAQETVCRPSLIVDLPPDVWPLRHTSSQRRETPVCQKCRDVVICLPPLTLYNTCRRVIDSMSMACLTGPEHNVGHCASSLRPRRIYTRSFFSKKKVHVVV